MVFHYLLKMCPDLSGNEREFAAIKEYIWSGKGARRVSESEDQVFPNFLHGYRPSCWSHFLYIVRQGGQIFGYAQLFIGPHAMFPPYRVDIGDDPARLYQRPRRYGHQFAMSNPPATSGFIGEMVDLQLVENVSPVLFGD